MQQSTVPEAADTVSSAPEDGQETEQIELVHLIYTSASVVRPLAQESVLEILEQSRSNNSQHDITGMLLYHSGTFFQVLEGEPEVVESLYQRIESDERHKQVTKLILEPIEERSFEDWSMGYPKISEEELNKISGMNDFFHDGQSFTELGSGRAKTLMEAFKKGRWRSLADQ